MSLKQHNQPEQASGQSQGLSRRDLFKLTAKAGAAAAIAAIVPKELLAGQRTLTHEAFEPTPVHPEYTDGDYKHLLSIDAFYKHSFSNSFKAMIVTLQKNNQFLMRVAQILKSHKLNDAGLKLQEKVAHSLNTSFTMSEVNDLDALQKKVKELKKVYGLSMGSNVTEYWDDWNSFNFGKGDEGIVSDLPFSTDTFAINAFTDIEFDALRRHLANVKDGGYLGSIVTINGYRFVFSKGHSRQKTADEIIEPESQKIELSAEIASLNVQVKQGNNGPYYEFPFTVARNGENLDLPYGKAAVTPFEWNGVTVYDIRIESSPPQHYVLHNGTNPQLYIYDGETFRGQEALVAK